MPESEPRIVVVQHEDLATLDRLAAPLAHAQIIRSDAGARFPDLADVDGVIVLGGTTSVADRVDWLPAVQRYLGDAVEHGVTTLAFGLGAQLLALAHGGDVQAQAPAGLEAGLVELRMRPDAETDPLLGPVVDALGRDVVAPQWHEDVISALPQEATWLASSRQYPFQAFRIGSAWGLQFHPEAGVEAYTAHARAHGGDVEATRSRFEAAEEQLATFADVLGRSFLTLVGDRVG